MSWLLPLATFANGETVEGAALIGADGLWSTVRPFVLEGREFFVTASIGIALSPQDGNELSQLMKNADTAMYRAKELGRNGYQLCTGTIAGKAMERLILEVSLRAAVAPGPDQVRTIRL